MTDDASRESELVRIERPADRVVLVRIDRPDARNALSLETRRQLAACFSTLSVEDDLRAIVLAGAPVGGRPYFAAGADISEFLDTDSSDLLIQDLPRLLQPISHCPKPVIAAVGGHALGGGLELALHADIIVAAETAQIGLPEASLGIMPGSGGTQRLVRAVGRYRAMLLLLTGQRMTAQEALAAGLVSEVVPESEVESRAVELATLIASMAPLAVRQIKDVMRVAADAPLESALLLERKAAELMFSTEDSKEGARAFLEKRKPVFRGK